MLSVTLFAGVNFVLGKLFYSMTESEKASCPSTCTCSSTLLSDKTPTASIGPCCVFKGTLPEALTEASQATDLSLVAKVVKPPVQLRRANQIPDDILYDPVLNADIQRLPSNYRFEVHKCIWQIRKHNAQRVALQFPEGLTTFACLLSSIFKAHCSCMVIIMADVTYGACCVDDFTARELGCDLLIHYGHSCLIPVTQTMIPCVYVFVEIEVQVDHIVEIIKANLVSDEVKPKLACVSTIQFISAVHHLRAVSDLPVTVIVPQSKPLSPGEILGCTAPRLAPDIHQLLYIGDGRFHLEAIMIANPQIRMIYKYDPYAHVMTHEGYDHERMHHNRREAIRKASSARLFGVILGTLGRQGSNAVVEGLKAALREAKKPFMNFLMTEIRPAALRQFSQVDAWIQVACPRLSIDWGTEFDKPILTPYEANVMLGRINWQEDHYPMDYYSKNSLGPWTVYHAVQPVEAKEGK